MLTRIFIGESDKHQDKPLYQVFVEMLRREKMAGATVLRGILSFGAKSHLHTAHILSLSQDMPVIMETVDTKENIDRILPEIEKVMKGGLITVETVTVRHYQAKP